MFLNINAKMRKCQFSMKDPDYGELGIALAAVGMVNPLVAAFIHVSSELTFILNSTRLLPRFARQPHLG